MPTNAESESGSPPPRTPARTGKADSAWVWSLPFLAWVLSFAPRIHGLGLYWDDYLFLRHLPLGVELRREWMAFPSRPGVVLLGALGDTLVGPNPAAWQGIMAALALGTALLLGLFTRGLCVRLLRRESLPEIGGAAAATLWLLFPWGLASTAWPGAGVNSISLPLFCAAGWALVSLRPGWTRSLLAAGLFLLSGTFYEAFWFESLMLVAVLWVCEPEPGGRGLDFAGQAFAQIALLFLNRLTLGNPGSVNHALHSGFLRHLAPLYVVKTALAALLILILRKTGVLSRRGLFPLLLLGLASILVSAILFAAAGYNLTPEGISSRAFLAVNFWIAAALGWIFGVLAARWGRAGVAALVLAGAVLAAVQAAALGHWERSWASQQLILSRVPYKALEALPARSVVIADLPPSDAVVADFTSCFDLVGAVLTRDPAMTPTLDADADSTAGLKMTVLRHWNFFSVWDGKTLTQTVRGGARLWVIPADHAYLWKYPSPALTELPSGWTDR